MTTFESKIGAHVRSSLVARYAGYGAAMGANDFDHVHDALRAARYEASALRADLASPEAIGACDALITRLDAERAELAGLELAVDLVDALSA